MSFFIFWFSSHLLIGWGFDRRGFESHFLAWSQFIFENRGKWLFKFCDEIKFYLPKQVMKSKLSILNRLCVEFSLRRLPKKSWHNRLKIIVAYRENRKAANHKQCITKINMVESKSTSSLELWVIPRLPPLVACIAVLHCTRRGPYAGGIKTKQ